MATRTWIHAYHDEEGKPIGGVNAAADANVTNGDQTEALTVCRSAYIDVQLSGTVAGAVIEGTLDPNSDTVNWFPCHGASGAALTALTATGLYSIVERLTYIRVRGADGSDDFGVRINARRL